MFRQSVLTCSKYAVILILYANIRVVHGRSKNVIPVADWFNGMDGYVFHNPSSVSSESPPRINIEPYIGNNNSEETVYKPKRTRKKRKKIVQKVIRRLEGTTPTEDSRMTDVEPKKKKKKRRGRKFSKTLFDQNIESNISGSREKNKRRKPVDIIVHIKMNE